MRATVKPLTGSQYSVQIRGKLPNGSPLRERYTREFDNVKHAQLWATKRIETLIKGEDETINLPTLRALWKEYETKHIEGQRLKPSQQTSLRSLWANHLEKHFGASRLDAIDYRAVQTFKGAMASSSPKTVNNVLIMLRAMLRFAVKMGYTFELPTFELLKVPKTQPHVYSLEEYNALVSAAIAMSPKHAAVVLLGGEAGLRAGEILALSSADLDLPMLTVRRSIWRGHEGTSKGNSERVIPLTARTVAVLREITDGQPPGPVLRSSTGKNLVVNQLVLWLRAAQEAAGVRRLSLHKLRHTYGTDIARTLGIRAAQVLLGHSDVKTTERYAHVLATPETSKAIERARAAGGQDETM